jgi:hypothetical protein
MEPRKTYGSLFFFSPSAASCLPRPSLGSLLRLLLLLLGVVSLLLLVEGAWEKELERDGKREEDEDGVATGVWGGV